MNVQYVGLCVNGQYNNVAIVYFISSFKQVYHFSKLAVTLNRICIFGRYLKFRNSRDGLGSLLLGFLQG